MPRYVASHKPIRRSGVNLTLRDLQEINMLQRQSNWMAKGALIAVIGAGGLQQGAQAAVTYKVAPAQSRFTVWSKTTSPLAKLRHTRELRTSGYSASVVMSAPNKPSS